jgi:hypothetical protein
MLGWLPVAVSSSNLDRVGVQEGRQVVAVSFPVPSVEAGPIVLHVRATVVVRGDEMVEQLLAVPQEGLPTVKGGATGRDGSQPVVRTVEDGEPEHVLWHGVVVGHDGLLVVLVGMRRRLGLVHE